MSKRNIILSAFVIILSAAISFLSAVCLYYIANSFDHIQNNTFEFYELFVEGSIFLAGFVLAILHALLQQNLFRAYSVELRRNYVANNFDRYYLQKNDGFIEGEISILINDIEAMTDCYSKKLFLIEQITAMIIYFTMLMIANWILGITLMLLSVLGGMSILISGKRYSALRGSYYDSIEVFEGQQKNFVSSKNLIHYTNALLEKTDMKCDNMCDRLLDYGLYRAKIVSLSVAVSNASMVALFIILALVYYSNSKISLVFLSFEYFEITLNSIKDIIININDILSAKNIKRKVCAVSAKADLKKDIKCFKTLKIINFKTEYLKNEITLTINNGDKILLLGKNGAGKTTLFHGLLNRIDYQGYCLIDETDIRYCNIDALITYMPQNPVLFDADFYDNITVFGALAYDEDTVNGILTITDMGYLKENKELKNASQGEKAVVLFIRTILYDSSILLFDEPFASLAPSLKQKLIQYLLIIQNKTIVVVEHSDLELYTAGFQLIRL